MEWTKAEDGSRIRTDLGRALERDSKRAQRDAEKSKKIDEYIAVATRHADRDHYQEAAKTLSPELKVALLRIRHDLRVSDHQSGLTINKSQLNDSLLMKLAKIFLMAQELLAKDFITIRSTGVSWYLKHSNQ